MQDGLYIRVKQAISWLKRNYGILQKDIADKMGMSEASFTRALARIKEKNDENFVISFHSAVSDFISLDYLLHGVGALTDANSKEATVQTPIEPVAHVPDMSSVFNAALAAKDETIASLKRELRTKEQQLADKDRLIESKEETIAQLKARLISYRSIIDKHGFVDLTNYPFTIGASEQKGITK